MKRIKRKYNLDRTSRVFWLYTKYQILSKLVVGLAILPLFGLITNLLIRSSGRTNISSGDYIGFLFSLRGIPLIIIAALLMLVLVCLDLNTFVIISSAVEEDKLKLSLRAVLSKAFKALKLFVSPVGLFIAVYIGLILPLLRLGISLGPFRNFKIPNFITSVIFNTPLYYFAYVLVLVLLTLVSIIYIFTFHYVLIEGQGVMEALKSSRQLMRKYWRRFILDYFFKLIKYAVLGIIVGISYLGLVLALASLVGLVYPNNYALLIGLVLSGFMLISIFTFISVPLAISMLSKIYYKYSRLEGRQPELKLAACQGQQEEGDQGWRLAAKSKLIVALSLLILTSLNFALGVYLEKNSQEILGDHLEIAVVAHRGGGDLGVENSLAGIEAAIELGVDWSEIDVQRTKDDHYILNHDKTFARLSGVKRKPSDLTLAEVKQLSLEDQFDSNRPDQEVASLVECLDLAKDRIGLFIELKGETADHQMVDDVVSMIKARSMLDSCVILSLDYDLIEYTEATYPEVETGFLYFFSVGRLADLKGDYLIMEEREASRSKLRQIHRAGKKAFVWTVNTPESIERFINSDVDGLITDHVGLVQTAIEQAKLRTPIKVIMDRFLHSRQ